MSGQGPEWGSMTKLVSQVYAKSDAEPFREPVDWKSLGLFDYPQIIKKPMDLGQVKRKIETGKYSSIHDAAEDMRLVWKNCMQYNADGSDFFLLAQTMAKKFEDKFVKLQKDLDSKSVASGGKGSSSEPTLEEKRTFAKLLYKISKEDLGRVIVDLDNKCSNALTKNSSEDEVEINVDHISPKVFHELMSYVRTSAESGGGGRKKKGTGSRPNKKVRTN